VVAVEERTVDEGDLRDHEVIAATEASLISAGTELANLSGKAELTDDGTRYPVYPGYAAAGRVLAAGAEAGVRPGAAVYMTVPHASAVRFDARRTLCLPLPAGLDPARATFARLASVSMTTLRLAEARAGDRVAVVGLGLVGNLAAQVFHSAGMTVVGYDIEPFRRGLLARCGLPARDTATLDAGERDSFHLVVEASGRAEGLVTALDLAAVGGEVFLVGAPWSRATAVPATALMRPIFLKYLRLRSGWEWALPHYDEPFRPGSLARNAAYALDAIARGALVIDPLLTHRVSPGQAQQAYDDLAAHKDTHLGVILDWQGE
jgi:2-desacetyl-2-hydroxyethyl bacteriochlorophyllide A dehydrogenase